MPISGPVSVTALNMTGRAPVLVLGLGNPLLRDDGVGLEMLRRLAMNEAVWDGQVEFLDGGTQGLTLLSAIGGRESLVVLDAIRTGSPAGTPHVFEGREVEAFHHTRGSSAHETDARELLQTAELLGDTPGAVALVGIEPEETTTGIGLSPAVLANLDDALGKARSVVNAAVAALSEKHVGRKREGEHYVSGGAGENQTD